MHFGAAAGSAVFESLGLERDVLNVYRSMLARRDWGVAEIAGHLAIDEAAVRHALDRLVDLDLLRGSWERPGHWRPVNPDVGLAALVSREQAELARRQEQIERVRMDVADLVGEVARWSVGPSADVEHLRGMDAVRGRLESLARETTREALSFTPGASQSEASFEASAPLDEAALARGVTLRTVFQSSAEHDSVTRRYVSWLAELGGECRTVPTLPLRMFVADRSVAVLPLDPVQSRAGALLIHSPGVVVALCALFETYWQLGSPFGERAVPRQGDRPSPQDAEILRLLAAGAKDETIARALGVSLRTTRRNVADLMTRLEASSRFQAGVNAVSRGWLSAR